MQEEQQETYLMLIVIQVQQVQILTLAKLFTNVLLMEQRHHLIQELWTFHHLAQLAIIKVIANQVVAVVRNKNIKRVLI
jgi:hypothetical protein